MPSAGYGQPMPLNMYNSVKTDSGNLDAGKEYVYDVEVVKPAGSPGTGQYALVHTLLTGKITITEQVTGA
jgi:hypothetical protein